MSARENHPGAPDGGVILIAAPGTEAAIAATLAGHIEETPDDWGCPECGSKRITVEAISGLSHRVPVTGLWASETHGSRAYLDWSEIDRKRGPSTTVFDKLRCEECHWSDRTRGDTTALRSPPAPGALPGASKDGEC